MLHASRVAQPWEGKARRRREGPRRGRERGRRRGVRARRGRGQGPGEGNGEGTDAREGAEDARGPRHGRVRRSGRGRVERARQMRATEKARGRWRARATMRRGEATRTRRKGEGSDARGGAGAGCGQGRGARRRCCRGLPTSNADTHVLPSARAATPRMRRASVLQADPPRRRPTAGDLGAANGARTRLCRRPPPHPPVARCLHNLKRRHWIRQRELANGPFQRQRLRKGAKSKKSRRAGLRRWLAGNEGGLPASPPPEPQRGNARLPHM